MTEPVTQRQSHVTQKPAMNTERTPVPAEKPPLMASSVHESETRRVTPSTSTVTQQN